MWRDIYFEIPLLFVIKHIADKASARAWFRLIEQKRRGHHTHLKPASHYAIGFRGRCFIIGHPSRFAVGSEHGTPWPGQNMAKRMANKERIEKMALLADFANQLNEIKAKLKTKFKRNSSKRMFTGTSLDIHKQLQTYLHLRPIIELPVKRPAHLSC